MNKIKIEVKEILSRVIEVESETITDAMEAVQKLYKEEEIVLDSEDFAENSFDIKDLNELEGNQRFHNYVLSNAEKMISHLSVEELAKIAFGDLISAKEKFYSANYEN